MHRVTAGLAVITLLCLATLGVAAEPQTDQTVPRLVRFSGVAAGVHGTVGVTFAFYADQSSETPLWTETQRVTVDETGRYSVFLGASQPEGLPGELFVAANARWLGVQVEGQAEQPRVLLVSVLYALKAADADTVGGKPISAFVLAGEKTGVGADGLTYVDKRVLSSGLSSPAPGGAGSANFIGMFSDPATLVNSVIYQTPAGSVGVNTTSPQAGFHAVSTASPVAFYDVYSNALIALPVVYRAARGTPGSPSAVQTNDILGGLAVRGYGATGFTQGRGQVMFRAAENWTDGANGTFLQFTTTPIGSTGWVERMRISPNGYVGIGALTPQSPLDIRLADSHTYASFGADTGGGLFLIANNPQIGFNLSYPSSTANWTRNAAGPAGYLAFGQNGDGMFSFATLPSGAAGTTGVPVPRMVISNTGNVGIGTTSPAALLEVAGRHARHGTPHHDGLCQLRQPGRQLVHQHGDQRHGVGRLREHWHQRVGRVRVQRQRRGCLRGRAALRSEGRFRGRHWAPGDQLVNLECHRTVRECERRQRHRRQRQQHDGHERGFHGRARRPGHDRDANRLRIVLGGRREGQRQRQSELRLERRRHALRLHD